MNPAAQKRENFFSFGGLRVGWKGKRGKNFLRLCGDRAFAEESATWTEKMD
jgi:hypothetical protein